MSLRFVYGRAGYGKSRFCLEDISKQIHHDGGQHPVILIVPEQFSFQAEKNLVDAVSNDVGMRARVLSFKRMAYRVLSEVGGLKREHMDLAGRAMLIYKIMNEAKGDLEIFSKSALHAGFVSKISDMIMELKRYAVTPEQLEQVAEETDEIVMKRKLHDVARIYEQYERQIHENYIDTEDDMALLCEKLDKSTLFDGAEVYFDEFSSFTPQQYNIIAKLMKKARRITVTLTMDPNTKAQNGELFALTAATEQRLTRLAADWNISLEEPVELSDFEKSRFQACDDIGHLQNQLYSFPFQEYKGAVENIRLFKALNVYAEVEELAKDITRLVRTGNRGLRYKDIAVATRDMQRYESLIRAVFDTYQIPCFIDQRRELQGNPLIVMLVSVLEIHSKNWSYETVFRYLKSGMTDLTSDEINLIENYVLACGIRGNRWFEDSWQTRLEYSVYADQEEPSDQQYFEQLNSIRVRIIEPLLKLFHNLKQGSCCRDYCLSLYEFLCDTGTDKRLETFVEEYKAAGDSENANKYTQVWGIVMDVLDQAVEILGDQDLTQEEFSKLLSIGFAQYTAGLIPSSLDQVIVGNVDRMRSHDIKALYVIGVNDGVFPRIQSEDGIFSDKDRDLLTSFGVELASGSRTKVFEEQFMIYSILSATSCYLSLSFPMSDHEGKTLRPSMVLSRVKRLFPQLKEHGDLERDGIQGEVADRIWSAIPAFNELILAMRNQMDGIAVEPGWDEVYEWYLQHPDWKLRAEQIQQGLEYSNQAAGIDSARARKLYGKDLQFSVSRLEKYSECPFAYFVKYGLKAKERKVYRATAPDIGTFMHNVLNEFSDLLLKEKQTWRDVNKRFCGEAVEIIVENMIEKLPGNILNSSKRYEFLAKRLKRTLATAVYIIAEQIKRSDFEPKGYEEGFGPREKYPPIRIVLENGEQINLIGRIDRIDEMNSEGDNFVRIIDYKSGNKDIRLTDVYYGLQLQLLTYLDAILESAGEDVENPQALSPAGILYFKIDDPIVKGSPEITDEEIEKLMLKELKFRGLLLDDIDVIRSMDRDIKGSSTIIPAGINADETLSRSSRVATREQFELLRRHVKKTITELSNNMLSGNIKINPYKKKNQNACTYCEYSSICQFDTMIKDNGYRMIKEKSNDEIWDLMRQETGGEKDGE